MSTYTERASIDVGGKVEKKNGLNYLSWAWAVDQLLRLDPAASWSYSEPVKWGETVMVFCTVSAFGTSRTAQLPVMDHRNKAIPNPDAFAVNTAMQRCLAKAIALHGIGLYIYAGEDIPPSVEGETASEALQNAAETAAKAGREAFKKFWTDTPADQREALKPLLNDLKKLVEKSEAANEDKAAA